MSKIQYTIRNIPPELDRYLRKLAKFSGKSLNQVVIDELEVRNMPDLSVKNKANSLDWLFGSGMDEETIKALEEDDKNQKELTRKEWGL